MDQGDETIPAIIREVFAVGVVPLARALPGVWRWAGRRPARLVLALAATPLIAAGLILYVLMALVVPLSVGCLLVLCLPVAAYLAIARSFGGARAAVSTSEASGSTPASSTGNTGSSTAVRSPAA